MAVRSGHDAVVLSALGCGAFGNPPHHVAKLFREVLESEFHGAFREVLFSVLDDHNAARAHNPHGNFRPFAETFGEENVRTAEFEEFASRLE